MVKSSSMIALLSMVTMGSVLTASYSMAQDAPSADVQAQETARRRAATKDALSLVSKAREAYQAKRYTEAVEQYRNALSVLPSGAASEKLRQFINESLSDALIARAIDYRSVGRTAEAVEFLREAIRLAPNNERAKTELVYTEDPTRTNPALTPAHVGDVEEVNRLLNLAYGYYDLGKYDEADKAFEAVVKIDPYNIAARRGMEQVSKKRTQYYDAAYDKTRAEFLAKVGEEWETAMNHSADPGSGLAAESSGAVQNDGGMGNEQETIHAAALEQMIVNGLVLEDNTIEEAIEVLRSFIKRFENAGQRSSRHIDVLANFGPQGSPEREAMAQRRASIQLDGISMKAVLDELAKLYDVDYYYVPLGIEFSYSGKDYGRLVDRVFNVPAHFFDVDSQESEDGEDDAFATPGRMTVKRANPVKVLKEMGVNFPDGANAVYRASTRRLAVRNTIQNLAKIEELLNAPTSNEWVVVLNVLSVETSQKNLEELGFDWLFNMHLGGEMYGGGGLSNAISSVTGMPMISNPQGGTTRPQGPVATGGLRSLNQLNGAKNLNRLIEEGSVSNYAASTNETALSPSIFGIRGVWTAADVTMMMRGLSQKTGADILQNPRLVFSPGNEEQVSIINVREMFYPESYDPPQIPVNRGWNNNNNDDDDDDDYNSETQINRTTGPSTAVVTGSHPTEFVKFGYTEEGAGGIGAIIQIHKAEPSADGQSVNLSLTTTINEFEGFVDWGTPLYGAMASSGAALSGRGSRISQVLLAENHIYQPIFKRRMVNTNVSIANGAVLVMGGMQESRVVKFEDKVPVLGDLPLIGRLFRAEGEEKEQRALLIFAKVDIVDPSGRNVNGREVDTTAKLPE